MNPETIRFLRATYKQHYFAHSDAIEFPEKIGEREFGYMPFGIGMVRHLSYKTPGEFVAEIVRRAPSSVYCSNARYESPTAPMEEKGWKGAELIFDIDADDIPTECKRRHNVWFCQSCGFSARLPRIAKCPKCSSTETREVNNICTSCLGATKEHLVRLCNILEEDFGVDRENMRMYFSGNRGYHLQIYDPRFVPLDSLARADIADYIRGSGTEFSDAFTAALKHASAQGETLDQEYGWAGKVSRFILAKETRGNSGARKSALTQRALTDSVSRQAAIIDYSVTTDVHRVFRMPGTLHGTTGLLKMRVPSLEGFDPLSDSVVLGSERVKITTKYAPRFNLKGEEFGPFRSESVIIPAYAAVYLLARDLAEVA
jgi:DNA primase small subunit